MTTEEFVKKLFELAHVKPIISCKETIKGEVFLTDNAFSKLVAADHLVSSIFSPNISTEHPGVIGTLHNSEGTTFLMRTNAMQRSVHRDYEGLGDGDMELRLFA
jgi:hypothetical protein